jgi:glycosyltransferase involved in cell wall biosynthesis
MKLLYLANIRMPTEKAHGLQIMQNCEAFAAQRATVALLAARRANTAEMQSVVDPFAYYGVQKLFNIERVPCLDLFVLGRWFERFAFPIQTLTYTIVLSVLLLFRRADVYYSRDALSLLVLSLFKPRRSLVYEAHQLAQSGIGRRLQTWCVRRVGLVIAITGRLTDDLRQRGATAALTAHDGFRAGRFAHLPNRASARQNVGLPAYVFLCGYVGQLHTMSMSKGIDILIDAVAQIKALPVFLCLVGGPEEMVEQLRSQWQALGLAPERLITPGRVNPTDVPLYIRAFDVCTMPHPYTEHYAFYTSPLKLFEYMAAGGAILSSDLPGFREVLRDGEDAILVPPGDAGALAVAIKRLYEDSELRARLSTRAQQEATTYTWEARAALILERVRAVLEILR